MQNCGISGDTSARRSFRHDTGNAVHTGVFLTLILSVSLISFPGCSDVPADDDSTTSPTPTSTTEFPSAELETDILDFGDVELGASSDLDLQVLNTGTSVLTAQALISDSAESQFVLLSTSASFSSHFHDFSKNSFNLSSEISLQLVQGLAFNIDGGYSAVHDQFSLPKSSASLDDVLLQQRELESQYNYWGSIGISYTFGSIYNNIVNPRFGN